MDETTQLRCNNNEAGTPTDTHTESIHLSSPHATEQNTSDRPIVLEKRLGLVNATFMIIAVIVGSGIFLTPKDVLKEAGSISMALIVWSVCGLLSLMGALCMAELGTSIPTSGGDYTYIHEAYGPLVGFLYIWVTVLVILPCSNAIAGLTFSNYVLKPIFPDSSCPAPPIAVSLMSIAIVLLLIYINCKSVGLSIKLQDSFTMTKILALFIIILFGAYNVVFDHKKDFLLKNNWWIGTGSTFTSVFGAFYSGFYSYAGWNSLNFVTEELKDPLRNMPKAIISAITVVTLIYIFANLAYFSVLSHEEIITSEAIAVTFSQKAFGRFSWIMPVLVGLSTTSGLNALIYSSSRILFIGARQGQLISALNMINIDNLTPVPSLMTVGFFSVLYLSTNQTKLLVDYLTFAEAGFGTLAVSTLLVFRYKNPNGYRPLKVFTFIPYTYLLVATLMILAPIYTNPLGPVLCSIITLLGIPVYFCTARWKTKPVVYQNFINNLTTVTQKLTKSVCPTTDHDS